MSVVSVERLYALHGTRVGTSKADAQYCIPGPALPGVGMRADGGLERSLDPEMPAGWNRVYTGPGNRPQYLMPGQWQTDNDLAYDMGLTNAVGVYDNAGGAHMNFHDACNVNGSLDPNTNAYRSNANGLEYQFGGTNPKVLPYKNHRQLNPNGFTEAYNPVEPAPVHINNSTAVKWSDALFQNW